MLRVFLVIFFACTTAYYAFRDSQKSDQSVNTTLTQTPLLPTSSPSAAQSPTYGSLQSILEEHCSDNSIPIRSLPFTLGSSVFDKYDLTESVPCNWIILYGETEESRSDGYVRIEKLDSETEYSVLKIGDKDSIDGYFGEEDFVIFDSVTPDISVGDTKVVVDILQPGPYGVSSMGIWLEVRAYKKVDELHVISKEFAEIEVEGDVKELMMQYADEKTGDSQKSSPEYTVNKNYDQFKQEFIDTNFASYPEISLKYKNMVDTTVTDVDSITTNSSL